MNTDLILLALGMVIIELSFCLYASSVQQPFDLPEPDDEADDLPFGPPPSDQD